MPAPVAQDRLANGSRGPMLALHDRLLTLLVDAVVAPKLRAKYSLAELLEELADPFLEVRADGEELKVLP